MMSIVDLIAIGVETLMIDSWCSLEKEFTKLMCMNPGIVLYITVNQVENHVLWSQKKFTCMVL